MLKNSATMVHIPQINPYRTRGLERIGSSSTLAESFIDVISTESGWDAGGLDNSTSLYRFTDTGRENFVTKWTNSDANGLLKLIRKRGGGGGGIVHDFV